MKKKWLLGTFCLCCYIYYVFISGFWKINLSQISTNIHCLFVWLFGFRPTLGFITNMDTSQLHLYLALMVIKRWGFFSTPYHLRGSVALYCKLKSVAVENQTPICTHVRLQRKEILWLWRFSVKPIYWPKSQ